MHPKVHYRENGRVCDPFKYNISAAELISLCRIGGLHGWQWIVSTQERTVWRNILTKWLVLPGRTWRVSSSPRGASDRTYIPAATMIMAFVAFFFMHDVRGNVYPVPGGCLSWNVFLVPRDSVLLD